MARIFSEEYGVDNRFASYRTNCSECGKRRLCYNTRLIVNVEALGVLQPGLVISDLKYVCMECAKERAFLITGKRKVRT